jgi:hypothetical protein
MWRKTAKAAVVGGCVKCSEKECKKSELLALLSIA